MSLTGSKKHTDRLRRMASPETIRRVGTALFKAGLLIQTEAQRSITAGAVSGKGHVPSRPGQPPKNDTSNLRNNIETVQESPLRVNVSSNAKYAIPLELGSSKLAARPYMAPAVAQKRDEATQYVRQVILNAIGG